MPGNIEDNILHTNEVKWSFYGLHTKCKIFCKKEKDVCVRINELTLEIWRYLILLYVNALNTKRCVGSFSVLVFVHIKEINIISFISY